LNSILEHTFPKLFRNGFINYGGSVQKHISRILSINFDKKQMKYILKIDEGAGQISENGSIQITKKDKTVIAYILYEEMLKIAYETIDFIKLKL
jgi:hypothetical protein